VGALDFFELEKEKTSEDRSIQLLDEMIEKWWCVGDERNRMGMWIQGASTCTKSEI